MTDAHQTRHTVVVPTSIDMVSLLGPGDEHLAQLEEALEADLAALAGDGLRVDVRRTDAPAESSPTSVALHLLGTDRPGIVAEISRTIAAHGVGIESLATDLREAPMAGGLLFEVTAELTVPAQAGLETLRAALEQIADELMVELSLE